MAQLALAWTLRRPEVSSAIVGASRPEQVVQNAQAGDVDLPDALVQACDDLLKTVAVFG